MKINTILTKDLSKEQKATLVNQYSGNKLLFRTLRKTVESKVENSLVDMDNFQHMDSRLPTTMAFYSGYRKAMRELQELLPKEDK